MKINKYTKAELISKFKELESKTNQKDLIKIYFNQIWELAITFKSLLLKITFISFITKIFLKYKLFRKLWTIINALIVAIFGISLLENSLFDFFTNIITEIRFISINILDYLANTRFYSYISNLFSSEASLNSIEKVKEINKSDELHNWNKSIESLQKENNSNNRWNIENSEIRNKSKISQYLESKPTITEEIQNNEFNYTKYLAIAALIVTASLAWHYSDEISTAAVSLYEWILSFRTGGTDNAGNNGDNVGTINTGNNTTNVETIENSPIELIDETKGKTKFLTPSQSFESLKNKAEQSWAGIWQTPDSPDSTDSNLTITQESFTNIQEGVDPSTIASSSKLTLENTSSIPEIVVSSLEKVDKEISSIDNSINISTPWTFISSSIINRMKFIQENFKDLDDPLIFKQISDNLVEIEIYQWELIERMKFLENKTQIEKEVEMLNNWISAHHNRLFLNINLIHY